MKNKKVLLTFIRFDGYQTFEWFKDIDEVNEFLLKHKNVVREISDCIEVINSKDVKNKLEENIQKKFILNKDAGGWIKVK